jgi:hypothetical protein
VSLHGATPWQSVWWSRTAGKRQCFDYHLGSSRRCWRFTPVTGGEPDPDQSNDLPAAAIKAQSFQRCRNDLSNCCDVIRFSTFTRSLNYQRAL